MKSRDIVPTAVERILANGEYIISATDTQGRVTTVNDVLVAYSGYTREELIGVQHNILRHPEMPRAVFSMAWSAISAGEDFSGYIKNLCKDGSFYWVFVHILPLTNQDGDITGYRSVRRTPRREALAAIQELYAQMLVAEQAAGPKDAIAAGIRVLREFLGQRGQSYEQVIAAL
jgi:PAS domain S-box-containing protein